jgi:4-amino-4-deoxy-L-arabinose transferase-like glycosyltransferase
LACAIALIALVARTSGIFESSIWVDDAWSIAAATGHSLDVRLDGMREGETYGDPKGPMPASFFTQYLRPLPGTNLWRVIVDANANENHPPLFYVLLYGWMRLFGFTVAAGRALSLLFGMAVLPVLFFLTRRVAGDTAAWIACLICALAPIQSQLAVQVRGYTLFTLLVLATAWMTLEMLEDGPTPHCVRWLTWLGVAGLLTHYFFPLYVAVSGLALLTQRRLWPTAIKIGAVWTTVLADVGFNLWVQPSRLAQPWLSRPSLWDPGLLLLNAGASLTDLLVLDPDTTLRIGPFAAPLLLRAVKAGLVVVVAALLFVAGRRLLRRHLVFLLAWLGGLFYLMFALDVLRHSAYVVTTRYMIGFSFPLYILLAAGLAHLRAVARATSAAVLLLALLAGQYALRTLPAGTLTDAADFQLVATRIAQGWQPNDLVVVQGDYGVTPICLAYYLPPKTSILALIHLPRPEKGLMVTPPNLDDLVPRLNQWVVGKPHLWVLRTIQGPRAKLLDDWLSNRYQVVGGQRAGWLVLREMVLR